SRSAAGTAGTPCAAAMRSMSASEAPSTVSARKPSATAEAKISRTRRCASAVSRSTGGPTPPQHVAGQVPRVDGDTFAEGVLEVVHQVPARVADLLPRWQLPRPAGVVDDQVHLERDVVEVQPELPRDVRDDVRGVHRVALAVLGSPCDRGRDRVLDGLPTLAR